MNDDHSPPWGAPPVRRRLLTRRRVLWALAAVAGAAAVFVALASFWVERSTRAQRFPSVEAVPARPVAIVLGARVHPSGQPFPQLEDRLRSALELYRAGKVRRILVSGDHRKESYDEVNAMHRWLLERGVPPDAIFLDHAGFRTLDTMWRAAQVYRVPGAIICTQGYHLPRALFLARVAGLDAVGLEADRRAYQHVAFNATRERLARAWAILDTYVWRRRPHFLGEPIPIDGDARASHDLQTAAP